MPATETQRTFTTTIFRDESMCFFEVPFDPKAVFGKVRAPVKVVFEKYTFRSTIFSMGGRIFIPLRKSNREAAGFEGGETVSVTLELDTDVRDVEPPADLVKALKVAKALGGWDALSFTHKREHAEAIEGAKKPETRERRIEAAVAMISAKSKLATAKPAKAKPAKAKPAKAKPAKAKPVKRRK